MWQKKPTRRDFLRALGVTTGAGSLGLFGCNGGNGPGPTGPTGPTTHTGPTGPTSPTGPAGVVVRYDVMSPQGTAALESYKKAVAAMKLRDPSDPTSWHAQARIHQDHCPHGNAFFLPWHRAYLYYFEAICRAASGDSSFALPYWNWTTHPTIPAPFWEEPLNDPTRRIGPTDAVPAIYVGEPVIEGILQINDFETFASAYVTPDCASDPFQRSFCGSGELEATPHNNVHGFIGGNMGTYMSPLDPIFWLHHCRVDQLWTEWNQTHANGDNAEWRDFVFQQNFVNPAGTPQDVVVKNTFSTQALGYRYDTQPEATATGLPEASSSNVVASAEATNSERARAGEPLRIAIDLPPEVRDRLVTTAGLAAPSITSSVRLKLGGVEVPGEAVGVHVFIGSADASTTADSPNRVATFGFFPVAGEHAEHGGPKTFQFEIGDDLQRLGDQFDPTGPLSVHVQTVPLAEGRPAIAAAVAPTTVRIEVVEISGR